MVLATIEQGPAQPDQLLTPAAVLLSQGQGSHVPGSKKAWQQSVVPFLCQVGTGARSGSAQVTESLNNSAEQLRKEKTTDLQGLQRKRHTVF